MLIPIDVAQDIDVANDNEVKPPTGTEWWRPGFLARALASRVDG
jgi:hypothetical protein